MSKQTETMQKIANQIADMMETCGTDWVKPWVSGSTLSGLPMNVISGKDYRGINILLLQGRSTPEWATYKQWKAKGANVMKGEKGTQIVFWKPIEKINSEGEKSVFFILKTYTVFNADQVEGYEYVNTAPEVDCKAVTLPHVEEFVSNTKANVRHGEASAYYNPLFDYINMPKRELFVDTKTSTATESYYSTLLHELTHWTGHSSRNDRLKGASFGDEEYAFEELVAELGATFLCQQLGISNEVRKDHAQYIKAWIKKLRNNPKFLFKAASKAQAAIDYVNGFNTEEDVDTVAA